MTINALIRHAVKRERRREREMTLGKGKKQKIITPSAGGYEARRKALIELAEARRRLFSKRKPKKGEAIQG